MLKRLIYVFIGLLLIQSGVAEEQEIVNIDFLKERYSAGETVQAVITTEPLERPLKAEQFSLYVNGVKKPIAPFFSRYSANSYLLYFDLPIVVNEPVYFRIEKILYSGSGVLEEVTVEKQIAIINEPLSILSIVPAFIVLDADQNEFQIQIENKKGGTALNITSSESVTHPYSDQLQIVNFNGKRLFRFAVDQKKLGPEDAIFINHEGVDYKINILKRQQIVDVENQTTRAQQGVLVFIAAKPEVRKTITSDMALTGVLSIKNEGNLSLENIVLQFIGDIRKIATMDTTTIPQLLAGQSLDITLSINEALDASAGVYPGILKAEAMGTEAIFPIYIEVRQKESGESINKTTVDLDLKENVPITRDPDIRANLSKQRQETSERSYPLGLMVMTLAIIVLGIVFSMMRKKKVVKDEAFDDYIKKIRK